MSEEKKFKFPPNIMNRMARLIIRIFFPQIASEIYNLAENIVRSQKPIDEKIIKAQESLHETIEMLQDLETHINDKSKYLADLQRHIKIAEIDEPNREAMLQEIRKGKNLERLVSLIINIIAGIILFILGIWLGPIVKNWFGIVDNT
jgi:hypothetical protein